MSDPMFPIPEEAERQLPPADKASGKASRAMLQRFPVWPIIDFLRHKKVPEHKHSHWYMMGGLALFFLVIQILTGILLMVYYRPSQPWQSVQRIVMEVPFGNVVRSVHHWSANLMILTLFLHMFSTFFMKAYRRPREATWLVGLLLLGLCLAFGFSGYLLPFDGLSFFATNVGLTEMEKAPVIGPWMASLLRGGPTVTIDTIGRFYVLHVVVLPLLVLALVGIHLLFVQVQGVSEPDSFAALPPEKKKYKKFFWEYFATEVPVWLAAAALLAALAAIMPRTLEPEADPFGAAPLGIKPEWYFLSQYQALKLFPGILEYVGMALMGLVPLLFVLVPFLDKSVPSDQRGKQVARVGWVLLIALVVLTAWGWLS